MDPTTLALRALPRETVAEEIANSVTHGVGLLLAIAGLAALGIAARARRPRRCRLVATALYLGMGWAVVGLS
ncbi:MAG TPA: hypothetical protein PLU30_13260 [Verrucomicrobiae bacterium]|nr:hypothetical protein [Verrucomicrobiae bacterium]